MPPRYSGLPFYKPTVVISIGYLYCCTAVTSWVDRWMLDGTSIHINSHHPTWLVMTCCMISMALWTTPVVCLADTTPRMPILHIPVPERRESWVCRFLTLDDSADDKLMQQPQTHFMVLISGQLCRKLLLSLTLESSSWGLEQHQTGQFDPVSVHIYHKCRGVSLVDLVRWDHLNQAATARSGYTSV